MSLKNRYPFLMNYFNNSMNSDNMAHCILFYGSDLQAQYDIALEIARILNCSGTKDETCNCLNCNWIRENKHPAVLTISRVDNKASGDEGKTDVNITINQAREIRNNLLVTSNYHRVLIFCDKDKEGNIQGLNQVNFPEITANALLKTFEEPPENTTFFFLTKDKSDLITTIVSRAQAFYVPSVNIPDKDISLVKELMDEYFELKRDEVLDFNDKLFAIIKKNDPENVFIQMQNYIELLLKNNLDSRILKLKLISDLKFLEQAKKENRLNMNIQTILENLCFNLILN